MFAALAQALYLRPVLAVRNNYPPPRRGSVLRAQSVASKPKHAIADQYATRIMF
jgi:hypothetical protein